MRAVRCHELTGPTALRLDHDVPDPTPGPSEVLIEVAAAGVNFPDVLLTRGKYQFKPTPPFSPGGEAAGTVRAVGANVTTLAVGDRVAATVLYGAFADKLVVPELAAARLPAQVSFEVGAATLLTYATTYHALVDRAALARGETLLVLGAAGGVGLAAVELGKLLGARVIAAASSDDKLALCRQHGADEAIDYSREDLKERVKQLTGGHGADVVYDPVGGTAFDTSLRCIAPEGRLIPMGFASGVIPQIPANILLVKTIAVTGFNYGYYVGWSPHDARFEQAQRTFALMERIRGWCEEGQCRPHVDRTFRLDEAAHAMRALLERSVTGRVAIVMD